MTQTPSELEVMTNEATTPASQPVRRVSEPTILDGGVQAYRARENGTTYFLVPDLVVKGVQEYMLAVVETPHADHVKSRMNGSVPILYRMVDGVPQKLTRVDQYQKRAIFREQFPDVYDRQGAQLQALKDTKTASGRYNMQ